MTPERAISLHREMLSQSDISFQLLQNKAASLQADAREGASELLARKDKVIERFQPLINRHFRAVCIRTHGDYHLGQVLYTGTDFVIIDYEGEPARPSLRDARRHSRCAMSPA